VSSFKRTERTKAEILDSAWDLVAKEGADVSLATIAKAAGISRQSIYDHFGSRGGMLIALVRRADDRLSIKDGLFNAFSEKDPHTRLDKTVDVWLDFVKEIYPVATDLIRLRSTDPDAATAWSDRMSELRAWLLTLTKSFEKDQLLSQGWTAQSAAEYLWAGISVQSWEQLTIDCGWPEEFARTHLKQAMSRALLV
jgi:AcrR family transcriptional regulator